MKQYRIGDILEEVPQSELDRYAFLLCIRKTQKDEIEAFVSTCGGLSQINKNGHLVGNRSGKIRGREYFVLKEGYEEYFLLDYLAQKINDDKSGIPWNDIKISDGDDRKTQLKKVCQIEMPDETLDELLEIRQNFDSVCKVLVDDNVFDLNETLGKIQQLYKILQSIEEIFSELKWIYSYIPFLYRIHRKNYWTPLKTLLQRICGNTQSAYCEDEERANRILNYYQLLDGKIFLFPVWQKIFPKWLKMMIPRSASFPMYDTVAYIPPETLLESDDLKDFDNKAKETWKDLKGIFSVFDPQKDLDYDARILIGLPDKYESRFAKTDEHDSVTEEIPFVPTSKDRLQQISDFLDSMLEISDVLKVCDADLQKLDSDYRYAIKKNADLHQFSPTSGSPYKPVCHCAQCTKCAQKGNHCGIITANQYDQCDQKNRCKECGKCDFTHYDASRKALVWDWNYEINEYSNRDELKTVLSNFHYLNVKKWPNQDFEFNMTVFAKSFRVFCEKALLILYKRGKIPGMMVDATNSHHCIKDEVHYFDSKQKRITSSVLNTEYWALTRIYEKIDKDPAVAEKDKIIPLLEKIKEVENAVNAEMHRYGEADIQKMQKAFVAIKEIATFIVRNCLPKTESER